jgi:hypothetical protein
MIPHGFQQAARGEITLDSCRKCLKEKSQIGYDSSWGDVMQTNWERVRDAVVVLAGSGPLKQRLADACLKHLGGIELDALPRDVRGEFAELNAALQSGSRTGRLSPVAACVLKMSEAEAARHAARIVAIFAGLHEQHPALPANRSATLLRAVPDDDLPAFLNRA